ncbi:polysaccharide pyruvyl transferase family protein [Vagococcus fluvialis]|uniref:polysaccharide pyruvyl transferase family protein n=1 Tax=Vagococcus fluvialis TaxID=2738 RepID=UPI003B5CDFB4
MNILVSAYLDNNLGDDLMIKMMISEFPEHSFYLATENSMVKETFKEIDNLFFFNNRIYDLDFSTFDLFIKIGGSMFIVNSYGHVKQRIQEIKMLKKLKKNNIKRIAIGSNYGPFNIKYSERLIKKELSLYNLLTVRDEQSYNLLEQFKLKNVEYHMYEDIVYNLKQNNKNELGEIFGQQKRNTLGISAYRSKNSTQNHEMYRKLAAVADEYIEQNNGEVKLIAFDSENENDLSACYHILNFSENKNNIEIVPYTGDSKKILDTIRGCNKFIAIRFHAAVLCDLFGIPFFPIAYSNKMTNLMNDKNISWKTLTIDELISDDLIDTTRILDFSSYYIPNFKRNHAENHFSEVRNFIKKIGD